MLLLSLIASFFRANWAEKAEKAAKKTLHPKLFLLQDKKPQPTHAKRKKEFTRFTLLFSPATRARTHTHINTANSERKKKKVKSHGVVVVVAVVVLLSLFFEY